MTKELEDTIKDKDNEIKSREDTSVEKAFELYMLKKFFKTEMNNYSNKILSYWEKDFDECISNHIEFFNNNIENQEVYNRKFSEIIESMNLIDNNDDTEKNESEKNQDNDDNSKTNNDETDKQNESQSDIVIFQKFFQRIDIRKSFTQSQYLKYMFVISLDFFRNTCPHGPWP